MDLVDERPAWYPVLGFALGLFLLLFSYFGAQLDARILTRVYALEALVLISLAFLIGSLSRFWPGTFDAFKHHRRPLGILGVLSASSHVFTVYVSFSWEPKSLGFLAPWAGFLIFCTMVVVSTQYFLKRLRYDQWKRIQLVGYLALALVISHMAYVLWWGFRNVSAPEWFVFGLGFFALLARLAAFLAGTPDERSYAEHVMPYQELAKIRAVKDVLRRARRRKTRRKRTR